MNQFHGGPLDGSQKGFVSSLRTLFNILDENGKGFVRLSDIERYWEENGVDGLPSGVVDALKRVTPSSGNLSFDRFVAGLKIAMLQQLQGDSKTQDQKLRTDGSTSSVVGGHFSKNRSQVLQKEFEEIQARNTTASVATFNGETTVQSIQINTNADRKVLKNSVVLQLDIKNKRQDVRRHTVATGIDHNMFRRLKQLQQEKEMLLRGLQSVETAKEWYINRLKTVDQRLKRMGSRDFLGDQSLEANQERLNIEMLRIQEVNQQLSALVESSSKGLSFHMNLAISNSTKTGSAQDDLIHKLKLQNEELERNNHLKSDRIAQLESEKTQLIQKMFEAKSERSMLQADATFI